MNREDFDEDTQLGTMTVGISCGINSNLYFEAFNSGLIERGVKRKVSFAPIGFDYTMNNDLFSVTYAERNENA